MMVTKWVYLYTPKNGVAPNLKPLFINIPNYIYLLTQNYLIHFPRMKMKTAPQLKFDTKL